MEKFEKKKVEIVKSPVDVILDGVILEVNKGKLFDMIPKEVHDSWDNLDKEHLQFKFEVSFEGNNFQGVDRVRFYDPAPINSNLSKLQSKYDGIPNIGDKVKIKYNSKGFGSILIE